MHDTPTKPLFNSASRAFSHGCVRVRNPQRFAEVIFAEDRGWGPEKIRALLDVRKENNQVDLATKIPVHVSYFTAWVDDEGKLATYRDVYGYEDRIHLGLDGKAHLIVKKQENLGQIRAEVVGRLADNYASSPQGLLNWMGKLFGN
jgi:murein L,D-transpeptidase YcbB/YkuD